MSKKALKGFTGARFWPLAKNTSTNYEFGPKVPMDGAQNLTKDVSSQDVLVYADDGVYYAGSDYQYEDMNFTVAELPLEVQATLQGADYDDTKKEYTFKTTDAAPEFAFGYAARRLDGEYRMFVHFAVRVTKITVEHRPRPDGTDIQAYQLTLRNTQRNADGAVRRERDSIDKTYAALDTMLDAIPAAPQQP